MWGLPLGSSAVGSHQQASEAETTSMTFEYLLRVVAHGVDDKHATLSFPGVKFINFSQGKLDTKFRLHILISCFTSCQCPYEARSTPWYALDNECGHISEAVPESKHGIEHPQEKII